MAFIAPFIAYYPRPGAASRVSCPPYDVVSRAGAARMASSDPDSYIRVIRAEVDFPDDADPYSQEVYRRSRDNLNALVTRGLLVPTPGESFFLYRLRARGREQTGVAAAVSLDEYAKGLIRKHELTRPETEEDRTRHMAGVAANTGQLFLSYRATRQIDDLVRELCRGAPEVDFEAEDGVRHSLWIVDQPEDIQSLRAAFQSVPALYVADGHHRIAAAHRLLQQRRAQKGGAESSNLERVMATLFPHNQVEILPYDRLVSDTGEKPPSRVMEEIERVFRVQKTPEARPKQRGSFGMFFGGEWYRLTPKSPPPEDAPVEKKLDIAVLQDQLLGPILGIRDPRRDPRLSFVGGYGALASLEESCSKNPAAIAFACRPTTMDELLAVADAGRVMPPKSTWFEPKLRSGLLTRFLTNPLSQGGLP